MAVTLCFFMRAGQCVISVARILCPRMVRLSSVTDARLLGLQARKNLADWGQRRRENELAAALHR